MKLQVIDQIVVGSVQADVLRPGQEIDVSDDLGAALLLRQPGAFVALDLEEAPEAAPEPAEKAAKAPQNKARKGAANKAGANKASADTSEG